MTSCCSKSKQNANAKGVKMTKSKPGRAGWFEHTQTGWAKKKTKQVSGNMMLGEGGREEGGSLGETNTRTAGETAECILKWLLVQSYHLVSMHFINVYNIAWVPTFHRLLVSVARPLYRNTCQITLRLVSQLGNDQNWFNKFVVSNISKTQKISSNINRITTHSSQYY